MSLRTILPALILVPCAALALTAAAPQDKKAPAAAGTWKLDPVHSTVLFKCKHVNVSYAYGRFDDVAGSITFDPAKPENSKVEITIQTGSVNTNAPDRDKHLASPDFLDAKQFTTATFQSKSVTKKGEKHFAVTGDLALHGVTKSVTIDMEHVGTADVPGMGKKTGFHGQLTIKRSDFGMKTGLDMIGDEVQLTLSVEADG